MSMWKKAMDYLGLGPDDAYDDYDVAPEAERPVRAARPPREEPVRQQRGYGHELEAEAPVRAVPTRPSFPTSTMNDVASRRPVPVPPQVRAALTALAEGSIGTSPLP